MRKENEGFGMSIPYGVRVISFATGIRWIGWGMAEPLIPVFLFSLLKSYGTAGFVSSIGEVVFLLILPIAGILADRISLKLFLIGGLAIFFFDGLWTAAAVTGVAALALVANLFDGVAVASDVVGRATYIRRHAPQGRIASVMGFQNAMINIGMIAGACISLVAVRFVSLPWIFFGIIPTNLAALLILAYYLKSDKPLAAERRPSESLSFKNYWEVWRDVARLRNGVRFLAGLTLLFNALGAFGILLIPIYAYMRGASLQEVIVLGIVEILPQLFASALGKVADSGLEKLIVPGLAVIALIVGSLAVTSSYPLLLCAVFILQVVLALLGLVVENIITAKTDDDHYGRTSAVFEGLKDVGKFMGAIGFGFAIDSVGAHVVFPSLAAAIVVSAIAIAWMRPLEG